MSFPKATIKIRLLEREELEEKKALKERIQNSPLDIRAKKVVIEEIYKNLKIEYNNAIRRKEYKI
jgi:hypothetical protein